MSWIRIPKKYSVVEILDMVNLQDKSKGNRYPVDGYRIVLNNVKMRMFKTKGFRCVFCGLEGAYFIIERKPHIKNWCLHLYSYMGGREILMTMDHIIPASKGGSNRLSNLQPMCEICNNKKGNKV